MLWIRRSDFPVVTKSPQDNPSVAGLRTGDQRQLEPLDRSRQGKPGLWLSILVVDSTGLKIFGEGEWLATEA